jgi:hypothetical protein
MIDPRPAPVAREEEVIPVGSPTQQPIIGRMPNEGAFGLSIGRNEVDIVPQVEGDVPAVRREFRLAVHVAVREAFFRKRRGFVPGDIVEARREIAADLGGHAPLFVGGSLERQLPLLPDHPQRQAHKNSDRQEDGKQE